MDPEWAVPRRFGSTSKVEPESVPTVGAGSRCEQKENVTVSVLDTDAVQRTYDLDRAHVFHSWMAQAAFKPMVITSAQGSYVVDGDGNRLLDFSSQLVNTNIGHQHPKVVAAIKAQADRLCTVAPQHANDQRSEAARLITDLTPDGLDKVFFTNAGAEAVENAVG